MAAKCLTGLAKGLRKSFKTHAVGVSYFFLLHCLDVIVHVGVQVLEVCLDRFREKKTNVIDALREASEAAYPAVRIFDSTVVRMKDSAAKLI